MSAHLDSVPVLFKLDDLLGTRLICHKSLPDGKTAFRLSEQLLMNF